MTDLGIVYTLKHHCKNFHLDFLLLPNPKHPFWGIVVNQINAPRNTHMTRMILTVEYEYSWYSFYSQVHAWVPRVGLINFDLYCSNTHSYQV